jgi:nucleotide-binding universal stress UspA family protein
VVAAGLACHTRSLEGRAAEEIVGRARELGAGLIVLGTHGRRGLAHMLLGSVAERVVQHAGCPVLTVPFSRAEKAA